MSQENFHCKNFFTSINRDFKKKKTKIKHEMSLFYNFYHSKAV